jgi:dolichol-phosphate mannosyltransferase
VTAPDVSIVVPTYREAQNLRRLVERIERACTAAGLAAELWLMDDDSRDGSAEIVAELARPWVRLVVRSGPRGLAPAVVDGLALARAARIVVMDADLSHPPERIPDLVAALDEGAEFVIGSRYVPGASIDGDWGLLRRLNSRIATLLARPFTSVRDPMAGFFALRREVYERADPLDPLGFKIGLELLVKCRAQDVREVPIRFAQRHAGESKLGLREQLRYLRHLRRLGSYRWRRARKPTSPPGGVR